MLLYRSWLALLLCAVSVSALGWGEGEGAAKHTPPPKQQPEKGKQGTDAAVKSSGGQPGKIGSFLKKALGPEIEMAQREYPVSLFFPCAHVSKLHS
jgi:hypothetical protein